MGMSIELFHAFLLFKNGANPFTETIKQESRPKQRGGFSF